MKILRRDEFGRAVEVELDENESFVKRWQEQLVENGMNEDRATKRVLENRHFFTAAEKAFSDTDFYLWFVYGIRSAL